MILRRVKVLEHERALVFKNGALDRVLPPFRPLEPQPTVPTPKSPQAGRSSRPASASPRRDRDTSNRLSSRLPPRFDEGVSKMGTRRIGHRAVGWVVATASSGTVAIGQELEDEARRQVQAIYADKAAWAPAQTKLDTSLLYASRASRGQPMAQGMTTDKDLAAVRRVANRARVEAGGTVVVDIRAKVTDGLILAIAGAGARSCSRSRPWTPSGRGFRCGKSRRSPRRFPIEESKTAP